MSEPLTTTKSETPQFDPGVRVRQFYASYLDSIYFIDYYKRLNSDITDKTRHMDFLIALGTALSGGSGLGILGSQWMAIPCGIITAASVVLSAAKQTYDWPGKSKFCTEMMQKYSVMYAEYRKLFDDVQASRVWTSYFESSYSTTKKHLDDVPVDYLPSLPLDVMEKIQDNITVRENPKKWWKPASQNGPLNPDP